MTGRRLTLLGCPLLAILLFLPTIGHGFVFDDRGVIVQNPLMHDAVDIPDLLVAPYWNLPDGGGGLYRPLTSVSFAIDRLLAGGLRPGWFHLVNVLLHGLVTFLLIRVALDVLRAPLPAAAVAGLLFAVHPVHVEAVAGLVGRADLLAAAAVLATLLLHRTALVERRPGAMVGAWLMALVAMMAKESGIVAPLLCALSEFAFPVPAAPRRRQALYAGYGAAIGIFILLRVVVLGDGAFGAPIPFVDNPAAAAGALDGRLTAVGAIVRYAVLLLCPVTLSADYSFNQIPVIVSPLDPLAIAGLALLALVVGGGAWLLRRSPRSAFALLFVAIAAAPISNLLVFIGTLQAERLMYLPSAGLCLLAGHLAGVAGAEGRRRRLVLGVCGIILIMATVRTALRLPDWRDDLSLYASAAIATPRSARIRHNLGNAYLRGDRVDEAETQFRAALAIYPAFDAARINLGMALLQQGRPGEALGPLQAAYGRAPDDVDIALDLGMVHQALGNPDEATRWFDRALEIDANSAGARNNLASIALARGDTGVAVDLLREAVAIDAGNAIYRVNLADVLMAIGRPDEAMGQFRAAARLEPGLADARRGMGEVALMQGDRQAAEREFRAALEHDARQARAANFLGYLMSLRGDRSAAVRYYMMALEIDPSLFDAHRSLGMILARDPAQQPRAGEHLEKALALAPQQPEAAEIRRMLGELSGTD